MQDLLSRLGTLDSKIDSLPLDQISRSTGFVRRTTRKAGARQWLRTICLLTTLPARSFRTFGWLLGLLEGDTHSRQNVAKRMHAGFERFLREVLERIVASLVVPPGRADPAFKAFGRVIVQDSTIIGLWPDASPDRATRLAKHLPQCAYRPTSIYSRKVAWDSQSVVSGAMTRRPAPISLISHGRGTCSSVVLDTGPWGFSKVCFNPGFSFSAV